ncbi:MAG: phenylalanine--tRNA ligase subunit beta [Candidatus Aminicenantes bacterium]|nr:phenylalanine--tRNA ligase subunit beta [Candidatus Aminicenantes bacterium]
MKISLSWLKQYIDLDISAFELVDTLNNIGLMVDDWEEKENEVILDIETYANRPDTLGHLGVARELAVALGRPLKEQSWPLIELNEKTSDLINIKILDEDLCPRYCGIIVRGVQVGPSPDWLREKIKAIGLSPINNVVDVTNYVLFSTAQPIHAFDLDKLTGRKIIVRKAKKGESLISLEEDTLALSSDMLVIADEVKPVALAGVIGGQETSVSNETQDVFIESAYFDPVSIRKTSKKLGIKTEASYRFERGADESFPPQAALMAASILTQMGGKATKGILDIYSKPRKQKTIVLRNHRVAGLLGLEIQEEFIEETLSKLGFQIERTQKGVWQVKSPPFRVDVEREADLIEEIVRFYGYDKIPAKLPPFETLEPALSPKRKAFQKLRQILFHYGFDEVVNFSFVNQEKEAKLQSGRKPIEIRNPVSSKASILRTTLIGGLLENISWNLNRGAEGVHVFETGNVYFWQSDSCIEQCMLALATTGRVGTTHWQSRNEKTDFFRLKSACEAFMNYLRYDPYVFCEEDHTYFELGHSLSLHFKGEPVGFMGLVRRDILDSYSIEDEVWAAEFKLEMLLEKQAKKFQYRPVTRFPGISRDISFIASQEVTYQKIKAAVEKCSIPYLNQFYIYDRFSGPSIPKGKMSLSLRFVFCHPQRTLLAEEVDALQERIIKTLKAEFNFQLREGGKIDK